MGRQLFSLKKKLGNRESGVRGSDLANYSANWNRFGVFSKVIWPIYDRSGHCSGQKTLNFWTKWIFGLHWAHYAAGETQIVEFSCTEYSGNLWIVEFYLLIYLWCNHCNTCMCRSPFRMAMTAGLLAKLRLLSSPAQNILEICGLLSSICKFIYGVITVMHVCADPLSEWQWQRVKYSLCAKSKRFLPKICPPSHPYFMTHIRGNGGVLIYSYVSL